jgi:hypothetical protein
MLKTAEQLQKANARFTLLVTAVVAAFAFSKEQEEKLTAEDFSAIKPAVEELQKPAANFRAALKASLKLSDEELSAEDFGAKVTAAISAKDTQISELTTRAVKAEGELVTANGEITKLKAEKKTADELGDSKSREIAARAGANLPAKQPGAGDQTTGNAGKATGTWREKLTSFWKVEDPQTA